ncbi:Atu protein [Xanthomonas translucens DAR61454]|nr:Atu protein [Xanthomonas translucens DAR61454]
MWRLLPAPSGDGIARCEPLCGFASAPADAHSAGLGSLAIARIALRDEGADDQLDLVVDHHRQHDRAQAAAGEQHLGHRHAGGQALFRAAEHDRNFVAAAEAQPPRGEGDQPHRQRQQQRGDQRHAEQRRQWRLAPQAFDHRGAEGGVHHQQDHALVGVAQHRPAPLDPGADPGPQQVAGDERHQQLQHDLAHRLQRIGHRALRAGQQAHQQWRQEHPEQARQRGAAHRRRHVAASHRGERDRRLHGGRQRAQEQHADVQLRGQQPVRQRLEQQSQQREQHESGGEDGQVQAPVQRAGDDRLARQARAVQEEQRGDGDVGDVVHDRRGLPVHRQQRGQQHGAEQGQGERFDAQFFQQAHRGWNLGEVGRRQGRHGKRDRDAACATAPWCAALAIAAVVHKAVAPRIAQRRPRSVARGSPGGWSATRSACAADGERCRSCTHASCAGTARILVAGLRITSARTGAQPQQLAQFVLVGLVQTLRALLGLQFLQPLLQGLPFQLHHHVVQFLAPAGGLAGNLLHR